MLAKEPINTRVPARPNREIPGDAMSGTGDAGVSRGRRDSQSRRNRVGRRVPIRKTAPGNIGARQRRPRGDAPECEFSARLSSRRPTSWRSPLSICVIAAAQEQKPATDAALRRLDPGGSSIGNPPVEPIGVVRRECYERRILPHRAFPRGRRGIATRPRRGSLSAMAPA